MSVTRVQILAIISFFTCLQLTACQSMHGGRIENPEVRKAAESLDFVSRSIDQFGTVSISGTTIIEPDPNFSLDLNLTGKDIFERNRVEGFSATRQFLAVDAQLSVIAEATQGMLGSLGQTKDPNIASQLREKIMGAALAGVIQSLPPEQRSAFEGVLDSINSGAPGSSASDGGQGQFEMAQDALELANGHLAGAASQVQSIEAAESDEDKAREAGAVVAMIEQAFTSQQDVAGSAEEAASGALTLALDAERTLATTAGASGQPAGISEDIKAAKAAANESGKLAKEFAGKISERKTSLGLADALKDKSTSELKGIVEKLLEDAGVDYREEEPKTLTTLLDKLKEAVDAAQSVAANTGTQIGPKKKLLKAPKINVADRLARQALPEMTEMMGNYSGPLDLNLRQLILLTAADKATLEMAKWLSYPTNVGPGKRVYLCMATANVTPGRDTYLGYMGQVDVYFEYARAATLNEKEKKECKVPEMIRIIGKHPITVAVHPLIDSQVLDLRSSRRQLLTMAFQAILNGYPAAGNLMIDMAKQKEHDVETVTGINTLTSYSTGSHFGFTFSPRLVAQDNPAGFNSRPQMILQPQTIPVMIMISCDESDLASSENPYGATDLQWMQTYQWRRTAQPRYDKYPGGSWIGRIRNPRLSETEFIARSSALDTARDVKKRITCNPENAISDTFVEQALQTRINALASAGIGTKVFFSLPLHGIDASGGSGTGGTVGVSEDNSALHVSPSKGWMNKATILLVEAKYGEPFSPGKVTVTVGGRAVNASVLSKKVLKVVVPAWLGDGQMLDAFEDLKKADYPGKGQSEPMFKAKVIVATEHGVLESEEDVEFLYLSPDLERPDVSRHLIEHAGETLGNSSKPVEESPESDTDTTTPAQPQE